jgi:hypothetical protein
MVAMYSKKMKVELVDIAVKPYPWNMLLLSYFYKLIFHKYQTCLI